MDLRLLRYFVAVAEERHFGRAAARLHISQARLSRAIKQLEADLDTVLLHHSAAGVTLTATGTLLYDEARTVLEQAADPGGGLYRPHGGLRAGLADIAVTRTPFGRTGIATLVLRSDPVGAVLRADDPLAARQVLHLRDLADRQWFQLPEGTDSVWRAYWNGTKPGARLRDGPVVRTISECLQGTLWNGTVGMMPMGHALPEGLACVRLAGMPPSRLVLAWNRASTDPLIRSFTRIAAAN